MVSGDWLGVPVGPDATGWLTAATQRTVLAVVHTLAGAAHIVDAVDLLACDSRVQVVFTQAPDRFSNGVSAFLDRLGWVVISWHQAVHTSFDLALVADAAGVHELRAPVLAVSHGVMNNKVTPSALAGPDSDLVVGLAAPWLTWFGKLVPAAVALSHDGLLDVLARQCRQAVPVASVVGDLCLDRLVTSRADRDRYRRALGALPGQTLVGVSSTWGPHSLFGRWRELLVELLDQLPGERYRVVAALHPAVWYGHGPRQVLGWLGTARRRGLLLVDPLSWRSMVAAADVMIGDHGSATVYAAATGVPVLRVADAPESVTTNSAAAALAAAAPVLSPGKDLAGQLRHSVRVCDRVAGAAVAALVSSRPGRAAALLRALMYKLLALPEPAHRAQTLPVDTGAVLTQVTESGHE